MSSELDRIARMLGYRDATRRLLSRMTEINNKLSLRLPRRQRKLMKKQFDACNYALELLNTHYWLMYGRSGDADLEHLPGAAGLGEVDSG